MGEQAPRWVVPCSLALAVLVGVASLAGLIDDDTYDQETLNWATQARGQDLGNLLAILTLGASAWLWRRGSFRAALVWVGALLYLVYAYLVYAVAVHFNELFLVYVGVLGIGSYALLYAVDALRTTAAAYPRAGRRRLAAVTLWAIGVLFALLWLSEVVPAVLDGRAPASVVEAGLWVNPIHVVDLALVLPAFVLAGVQALRGRRSGLFLLGPWLVFSVLMGASIVAAMVLLSREGFDDVVAPMAMVSVVVAASLLAAWRYLSGIERVPAGDAAGG